MGSIDRRALERLPFPLRAEIEENLCRKDLAPSEIAGMRRRCEAVLREEARKRQAEAGPRQGKGRKGTGSGKRSGSGPEVRDQIGAFAGVSGRTLDKITAVVEAAEADPALRPLVEEMDRTGRVSGVHRKLVVARQAAALNAKPPPLPEGPYDVVVLDPPWRYGKREGDSSHRGANPYASMDLDAIRALPVPMLAAKDAVLWLWTTNAHIFDAKRVVDTWGFAYKTKLTWDKERMGTGDWLRGQTEDALLCVRGKPVVTLSNQTTLLRARAGRHSEKPDAFYALVESLCPGSKLDMFARKARPGWATWGLEAPTA